MRPSCRPELPGGTPEFDARTDLIQVAARGPSLELGYREPVRIIVAVLLLGSLLPAEDDISTLLEAVRAKNDVPALGGAIVRGNKLVAIGATGVRKVGADTKVTIDDRWHLGSCTKSMTATLLGRFVERKELDWDRTLRSAFPKDTAMHAKWQDTTVGQLLRHRGGAPSDLSFDGLWGRLRKQQGTTVEQRGTLSKAVLAREPGPPKFLYSNAGYAMAGHALELQTNKPWEELMREELFKPLGMKSAGFGAPGPGLTQPWGHMVRKGVVTPIKPGPNADNPPAIGPAGAVHLSLRDWAKYIALHLRGAREGSDDLLLQRATLRRIQSCEKGETYAYGWIVTYRPWGGGKVLTHAGSNTVWYCVVWIAPEKNFAVLATCNMGGDQASRACDQATSAMIVRVSRP